MTISVKKNGVWNLVSTFNVKKAGTWKAATGIGIRKGGLWKQAFGTITPSTGALDATINSATTSGSRAGPGSVVSAASVITPSGGTGPYTYAWSKVSGTSFTITSAAAASTTFSNTMLNNQTLMASYKCIVTDSLGATIEKDVDVTLIATDNPPLTVVINLTDFIFAIEFPVYQWQFSTTVTEGNGSYAYVWSHTTTDPHGATSDGIYKDASARYLNQSPSTMPAGKTYTLTVVVTDTTGKIGTANYIVSLVDGF